MKTEKIVWGLILIFIGTVFLLDNFNVIEFYWGSVWRFWPVVFILIGANMLLSRFGNKNSAPILAAAITIITLCFIGYQGTRPDRSRSWFNFHHGNDRGRKDTGWSESNTFSEPYGGVKRARLNIQGGATSYRLGDSTSNLFEAEVKQQYGRYTLNKSTDDSVEVLNFRMRNNKQRWSLDEMEGNETRLRIHKSPVWDIKIEMGAGEAIFDLASYKVRTLRFEGGAASFEAKIGSAEPVTDVFVETGVASVEIEVPSASGCRIEVDSGLSSKDFTGFIKQADGTYETSNYNTAGNKINISLKGGLSSFEVKKY